jgi:hypothetical protein
MAPPTTFAHTWCQNRRSPPRYLGIGDLHPLDSREAIEVLMLRARALLHVAARRMTSR